MLQCYKEVHSTLPCCDLGWSTQKRSQLWNVIVVRVRPSQVIDELADLWRGEGRDLAAIVRERARRRPLAGPRAEGGGRGREDAREGEGCEDEQRRRGQRARGRVEHAAEERREDQERATSDLSAYYLGVVVDRRTWVARLELNNVVGRLPSLTALEP